ncbi:hypothetical protein D9M69_541080 [compost metagenome]
MVAGPLGPSAAIGTTKSGEIAVPELPHARKLSELGRRFVRCPSTSNPFTAPVSGSYSIRGSFAAKLRSFPSDPHPVAVDPRVNEIRSPNAYPRSSDVAPIRYIPLTKSRDKLPSFAAAIEARSAFTRAVTVLSFAVLAARRSLAFAATLPPL